MLRLGGMAYAAVADGLAGMPAVVCEADQLLRPVAPAACCLLCGGRADVCLKPAATSGSALVGLASASDVAAGCCARQTTTQQLHKHDC